jgi:hypothetical protein
MLIAKALLGVCVGVAGIYTIRSHDDWLNARPRALMVLLGAVLLGMFAAPDLVIGR